MTTWSYRCVQEAHRQSESNWVIAQTVIQSGMLNHQHYRSLFLSSGIQPQNKHVRSGSDQVDRALNKLNPVLNVTSIPHRIAWYHSIQDERDYQQNGMSQVKHRYKAFTIQSVAIAVQMRSRERVSSPPHNHSIWTLLPHGSK